MRVDLPMEYVIGAIIAIVGGPTSAAWIGVRIGLNGVRSDIGDIKKDISGLRGARETDTKERHLLGLKVEAMGARCSLLHTWDGRNRRRDV